MSIAIEPVTPPLALTKEGAIVVGGTRVPLDSVIGEYLRGETAEEIAQNFTSLRLADIYYAIGYYLNHRNEVDAYLATREQEHQAIRNEIQSTADYQLMRERFLARVADRGK